MDSILLVDDDIHCLQLLSLVMESTGYDVKATTNPNKALDILRNKRPGVVITDFNMPMKNGVSLAIEMMSINPHVPIIMVTGDISSGLADIASKAGIMEVLPKPVDIKRLISVTRYCFQIPTKDVARVFAPTRNPTQLGR